PGAGLEPRDFGLRLQDVGVHRLGQRLEVRLDAIGERPRRALREGRGAHALAAREERLDLADGAVVTFEGLAGVLEEARLLRVRRVLAQADQARAQAIGALVPG